MNEFSLQGKRALVTGGGTGIGLAIAKAFAGSGARVIIAGRRHDVLRQAAAAVGSACETYVIDVAESASHPAAAAEIEGKFGPLDILVNNAGTNLKKPFLEVTDEETNRILRANLSGLMSLTREVARGMSERRRGCVLNITSMAAMYGIPKVAAYTASKSAVLGLTRELAVELAPYNIRVNAVAPGFIYSEMSAKALDSDPERKARVMARTPMGRMGRPEDVAVAAVFLCSDAANFITGINLPVDGGNSIGF